MRHWMLWLMMVATAAVVIVALPLSQAERAGAGLGAGLAALSGAMVLLFRSRAIKVEGPESISAGLKAVGASFVARLLVLAAGLYLTKGTLPFVWGFFALYFLLQVVEVRYLVSAGSGRPSPAQ